MEEIWKTIGLANHQQYEVSSTGQIKNTITKNILTQRKMHDGYRSIKLGCTETLQQKNYLIHRIVAITYIPNPDNKKRVNHKNHDKADNRIENLEWFTQKEQNEHRRVSKKKDIVAASRPVWKCDIKTGEKIERFNSMTDAVKSLNKTSVANICSVLKQNQKTAYGFKWEYDEYEEITGEIWKEIDPKYIKGGLNYFI